jgi:hypothetical protein
MMNQNGNFFVHEIKIQWPFRLKKKETSKKTLNSWLHVNLKRNWFEKKINLFPQAPSYNSRYNNIDVYTKKNEETFYTQSMLSFFVSFLLDM